MENTLTSTSDLQTCCCNDSILTINDDGVGINIKPFLGCKITPNRQCRPIPFVEPLIRRFGTVVTPWNKYAEPFGDIDERILTEASYFICANSGMTKVNIADPGQDDLRVGDQFEVCEKVSGPVFPVGGGEFNIGYDRDWNNFGEGAHHSSDFSFGQTDAHHTNGHLGVDIFAPKGAPILAMVGGEVVSITAGGNTQAGGNRMWVKEDLGNGTSNYYYYPHLDTFNGDVAVGDVVDAGDPLGTLGNTGKHAKDTAPHLHFSIFENVPNSVSQGNVYSAQYAVDPFSFLQTTVNEEGEPLFGGAATEDVHTDQQHTDELTDINPWDRHFYNMRPKGKLIAVEGATIVCPNAIILSPPVAFY